MLFETPGEFNTCIANNPSICFTATPGDKDNSLEKKIQEHMGFKILEDQDPYVPLNIENEIDETDVVDFIKKKNRPALIFCDE